MEKKKTVVQGYTIIERKQAGEVMVVVGHHPTAPAPYVTWKAYDFTNFTSFNHGHYFQTKQEAMVFRAKKPGRDIAALRRRSISGPADISKLHPTTGGGFVLHSPKQNQNGGDQMADAKVQQPPVKIERTIGSTTYIVTSHFQEEGSTAVDKIRCLLDTNIKANNTRQKS